MMTKILRSLLVLSMTALLVSCTASHVDLGDPEANVLRVVVVSDLVPQHEVATIQVALFDGSDPTSGLTVGRLAERTLTLGDPLFEGVEAAAFEGLEEGDYTVRITCMRSSGEVVARNVIALTKSVASMSVRVHVMRVCSLVDCDQAGSTSPACLAGMCVDPRCSPETPEFCPPELDLFCDTADDCAADVPVCLAIECVEGVCMTRTRATGEEGACSDDETCEGGSDGGCVPNAP